MYQTGGGFLVGIYSTKRERERDRERERRVFVALQVQPLGNM